MKNEMKGAIAAIIASLCAMAAFPLASMFPSSDIGANLPVAWIGIFLIVFIVSVKLMGTTPLQKSDTAILNPFCP